MSPSTRQGGSAAPWCLQSHLTPGAGEGPGLPCPAPWWVPPVLGACCWPSGRPHCPLHSAALSRRPHGGSGAEAASAALCVVASCSHKGHVPSKVRKQTGRSPDKGVREQVTKGKERPVTRVSWSSRTRKSLTGSQMNKVTSSESGETCERALSLSTQGAVTGSFQPLHAVWVLTAERARGPQSVPLRRQTLALGGGLSQLREGALSCLL